ncbi:hypothetical protein ACFLU2_02410 [Chloroflexota bacterium]
MSGGEEGMFKVMMIYSAAGSIIGVVTQAIGLNIAVVFLTAILIPPIVHLSFIIARSKGIL